MAANLPRQNLPPAGSSPRRLRCGKWKRMPPQIAKEESRRRASKRERKKNP